MSASAIMPQQSTGFVGRQHAIAEVSRLLGKTRLLTLTGIGGCGKTRLAMQVLPIIAKKYANGVAVVQLEALTDPALLPQVVASAIGVQEQAGQPLTVLIVEELQDAQVLLVLDTCEHLQSACASLVSRLIGDCHNLTVLATSRESLNISGEFAWSVPPLSLPPCNTPLSVQALMESESAQLFVERARVVRPDFVVTPGNAQAVARLCCGLDGLPLAIELAAARTKVLTVQQIADRLDARYKLLTSESSASLPRHHSLQALIDWSYDLLTDTEKRMLRRLSVFAGGCTLEAAEAVCGSEISEYELIDTLSHLVDKSLLIMEERDSEAYYRLLETIRAYAMEKLTSSGEEHILRSKHRDWYFVLAERAQVELTGENQEQWLNLLETEHDNLRAALELTMQEASNGSNGSNGSGIAGASGAGESGIDPAEAAWRLSSALWRFWDIRGYLTEGRRWLNRALAISGSAPSPARAKALTAAGNLAFQQGDDERAVALHTEALAVRRQIGDRNAIAASLANIGVAARSRGDYDWSEQLYAESLAIFQELNQTQSVAGVLQNLGFVAQCRGEYAKARKLYQEALVLLEGLGNKSRVIMVLNKLGEIAECEGDNPQATILLNKALAMAEELGDKLSIAAIQTNLGKLASHRAEYKRATDLLKESLTLCYELGRKEGIARCLEALAEVFLHGQPARAAQLFGAAEALRERIGMPLPPYERPPYDRAIALARAGLSGTTFAEKWSTGRSLSLESIIKLASSEVSLSLRYRGQIKRTSQNGTNGRIGGKSSDGGDVDAGAYSMKSLVEEQIILTARECEVLALVARGLTDPQIAIKLSLSPRTIHSHLYSIYNKLQVTNRTAAIHYALQYDLV